MEINQGKEIISNTLDRGFITNTAVQSQSNDKGKIHNKSFATIK